MNGQLATTQVCHIYHPDGGRDLMSHGQDKQLNCYAAMDIDLHRHDVEC